MVSNVIEVSLTLCGIAVPSALLFACVRRWFSPLTWRFFALFVLLVMLFLGVTVWTPSVPVPVDEVVRGFPYRGVFGPVVSKNPLTNDTVKQMLPWMQLVREQVFSFELPLWNPYSFSGYPLLGNAQSIPFSPFFLATIFVPLPKQIVAMAGFKIFTGLLFGFLLLREYGRSRAAAIFGSATYAFSVFQNVYLYYPLSAVTYLLPAIAYAILLCFRRPGRRSFWLVALVTASLLASGHPESVFHVAMAAAILLGIEMSVARSAKRALLPVGAAVFGAVISAPAWVPVLEVVLHSDRLRGIGAGLVKTPAFPMTSLWVFLNPNGFGNPARGNWNWQYSYVMIASAYVGLIALSAFPLAFRRAGSWRREALLAVCTVGVFLIAMNWTFIATLFTAVPPLSWVVHDRLRFVVCFFVAIIAARVVDDLPESWPVFAAISTVVLALSVYLFVVRLGLTLRWSDAIGLFSLLAFLLFVIVSTAREQLRPHVPLAAAILCILELLMLNHGFNALASERYYRPETPLLRHLAEVPRDVPWRIVGRDWAFLPNASVQYHLEDVRGSDPMALSSYAGFFRSVEIDDPVADVKRVGEVESPLLDFLNVRFLIASPGDMKESARWRLIYSGRDGELYENRRVLPRFFSPRTLVGALRADNRILRGISDFSRGVVVDGLAAGERQVNGTASVSARSMSSRRFRLTVDAGRPLLIASSEPAMTGWSVQVNGKSVRTEVINRAFLGFMVPVGRSKVLIEYRPASFFLSSGLSMTVLVCGVFVSVRRRSPRSS